MEESWAVFGLGALLTGKSLSNGLSWVSPDELSGLTGKAVRGAFTCVLEACAVRRVREECHGRRKRRPHHGTMCYNGACKKIRNPVYHVPAYRVQAGCESTETSWLYPFALGQRGDHSHWLILTLEVRSSTDPTDDGGITGVPTPSHQRCSAICWGMPHQC